MDKNRQVYVVHANDAVEGVFVNFDDAKFASIELLEDLTDDTTTEITQTDTFYAIVFYKKGKDPVVRLSVEPLINGRKDKRTSVLGFEYMSAGAQGYPAFWSLDTNLCQFLAHNLEMLSNGVSAPSGWDGSAWESFLRFHARHLRAYAEHKFCPDGWFDWETEIANAQRALRNVALVLPHLWD